MNGTVLYVFLQPYSTKESINEQKSVFLVRYSVDSDSLNGPLFYRLSTLLRFV